MQRQPDQAQEQSQTPIVVLDVDDTLIFDTAAKGAFNDELIDAMIAAGVTEVYLLTSFNMDIMNPDPAKRIGYLSRLDLIEHLKNKGITVKAVVCDGDILPDPGQENLPGSHYKQYIEPIEKLIRDDPNIDLKKSPLYHKAVKAEKQKRKFIGDLRFAQIEKGVYDKGSSVKAPLADWFFRLLGKDRQYHFFDDSQANGDEVIKMGKKAE